MWSRIIDFSSPWSRSVFCDFFALFASCPSFFLVILIGAAFRQTKALGTTLSRSCTLSWDRSCFGESRPMWKKIYHPKKRYVFKGITWLDSVHVLCVHSDVFFVFCFCSSFSFFLGFSLLFPAFFVRFSLLFSLSLFFGALFSLFFSLFSLLVVSLLLLTCSQIFHLWFSCDEYMGLTL